MEHICFAAKLFYTTRNILNGINTADTQKHSLFVKLWRTGSVFKEVEIPGKYHKADF